MDSVNNVCRLCATTQNLEWVFDRKLECVEEVNLVEVISTITGIKILPEDVISQKICTECYQISIKIDQFRMRAKQISNILMERYREVLNTEAKKKMKPKIETEVVNKQNHKIHQSVKGLLKHFPRLNLPSTWLTFDIDPCVILDKDAVENYQKKRARNEQQSERLDGRIYHSSIITANPKKRRRTDNNFNSDSRSSEPFSKKMPVGKFAEGLLKKSIPLFICSICESVHNNVRALDRHYFKHLRCPFCRLRFRTIDSKEAHIKGMCAVKNMIQIPSVELEKIELDLKIRTKYPEAFISYPLITEMQLHPRTTKDEVSGYGERVVGCVDRDDDANLPPRNDISKNIPMRSIGMGSVRINTQSLPMSTVTEKASSTIPSVMPTSPSVISTNPLIFSSTRSTTSKRVSSAYAVEPDITIKNSSILDKIDRRLSNIEVVGKLLTNTTGVMKEESSQTELPCSESICVMESGDTIELRHLRNSLYMYDIPFVFKKGDFCARYDYNSNSKSQQAKKLCMWDDLTPIDVEVANGSTKNEGSAQDKIPVVTPKVAKGSFSTLGGKRNCTELTMYSFNPSFSADHNQQAYGRNNHFSTTSSFPNGSYNVDNNIAIPSDNFTSIPYVSNNTSGEDTVPFPNIPQRAIKSGFPSTKSTVMGKVSSSVPPPTFAIPMVTSTSPSVLSPTPSIVSPTRPVISTIYNSGTHSKSHQPEKLRSWNGMNALHNASNNGGSVQDMIHVATPEVTTKTLSTGNVSYRTITTMHPLHPPFIAVPVQTTCSMNQFSTPVNFSAGMSKVNILNQVVSPNFEIVNKDPCSKNLNNIRLRLRTAKQQSNTNAMSSFTVPDIRKYPMSANMTYGVVVNDSRSVHPKPTMARLQPRIYCQNDKRKAADVDPFGIQDFTVPERNSVVSRSDDAPNVSYYTNTVNSFTAAPDVQKYPVSENITSRLSTRLVANGPISLHPEAAMAGLQAPIYYHPDDERSTTNVNPCYFPNSAFAEMNPIVSHSFVNNAPNITHSTIYNLQKSLTVQNEVPSLVPISTADGFNDAGPVFARIRVKSLKELM